MNIPYVCKQKVLNWSFEVLTIKDSKSLPSLIIKMFAINFAIAKVL